MENTKTLRARAIIFKGDELIAMYRERDDRVFYSLPGGGVENNESLEDCVKREVLEEFGIVVEPIKQVYIYHNPRSIEYFYTCKWVGGEFGSGKGEEFLPTQTNGVYKPTFIKINKIPTLPLMPPEVATELFADYTNNGENLTDTIKTLYRQD